MSSGSYRPIVFQSIVQCKNRVGARDRNPANQFHARVLRLILLCYEKPEDSSGRYAQQGQRISVAAMACAIRQRSVLIESST